MIASTLSYKKWAEHLAKHLGFLDDFYTRKSASRLVDAGLENYIGDLRNTKLLMLHSEQDKCVCPSQEESAIQTLRQMHNGKEGIDWKYMIVPVKGHTPHSVYNIEAMKWTKKWMTSRVDFMQSRI
ncbi:hypothetical protein K501DRAFT_279467 [Backusella circina FSU 941]|nr:hypothetical protein K501DRAFT_279467 [Backusella circina FSU 941]